MVDLLIFWGESEQTTLTWKLEKKEKKISPDDSNSGSLHESYKIQSENILKADLSCLADIAISNKVSLILPTQDIVSAELQIPNRNPKLLRKVIPFMMEDEVATSVDSLFYAYKDNGKDKAVSVRGIDRGYIESLIAVFASAEIKLEHILLEQDLMLRPDEGFNLLLDDSDCSVISPNGDVWTCYPEDFNWLILKQITQNENSNTNVNESQTSTSSSSVSEKDEDLSIAISLNIYSQNDCSGFIKELPIGRFAPKTHLIENRQNFLAQSFEQADILNLMQDEYEPSKEKSELGLFLTKAASIAAAIFITFVIFQSSQIITLGEQKEQLDDRKMTLYKQAFPTRKTPSSSARALKNMRDYMRSTGSSTESSGFLEILESSSQSLNDLSKVYPTNISYDVVRNELRLDLIASNLVELDKFADALKSSGHQVERSSETQTGDGYSSRLSVRN